MVVLIKLSYLLDDIHFIIDCFGKLTTVLVTRVANIDIKTQRYIKKNTKQRGHL